MGLPECTSSKTISIGCLLEMPFSCVVNTLYNLIGKFCASEPSIRG